MMNFKQRVHTLICTKKQLEKEVVAHLCEMFPSVSSFEYDGITVDFEIGRDSYRQWRYDDEPEKRITCQKVDFSEMTDKEILEMARGGNTEELALEVGQYCKKHILAEEVW